MAFFIYKIYGVHCPPLAGAGCTSRRNFQEGMDLNACNA